MGALMASDTLLARRLTLEPSTTPYPVRALPLRARRSGFKGALAQLDWTVLRTFLPEVLLHLREVSQAVRKVPRRRPAMDLEGLPA